MSSPRCPATKDRPEPMAHTKRRVTAHMMEDRANQIFRNTLPGEWVVREYRPDYGIDLMVEVFEPVEDGKGDAETLGEWFFVQLKSAKTAYVQQRIVHPRFNIEKVPPTSNHSAGDASHEQARRIEVIPYRIDVNELLTVQAFGVAVPILLVFVALDTERVHFICLNDLIDKYLVPEQGTFATQQTKTIHIPLANALFQGDDSLTCLRFLAKRPKMYAAFAKFAYQHVTVARLVHSGQLEKELALVLQSRRQGSQPSLPSHRLTAITTIRHFLQIIKRYDFWQTSDMWSPVPNLFDLLVGLEERLDQFIDTASPESSTFNDQATAPMDLVDAIFTLWNQLLNLGRMYEELCREWFLPTYLGDLTNP